MNFILSLLLSSFFGSSFVQAATNSALIEEKLSFKAGTAASKNKKANSLKTLKELEQSKKWKECQNLAPAVMKSFPTVKGWALQTWAICAGRPAKDSTSFESNLVKVIEAYQKNSANLSTSVAWRSLRPELQKDLSLLIESKLKSDPKSVGPWIQTYQDLADDRETRARSLSWMGELSMTEHQLTAAESFFEQSLQLFENKTVRDRLQSVRLALNVAVEKKESKNPEAPVTGPETMSDAEIKFEERFKTSLKNNDLLAFVTDSVAYLNQFPNGRRAKSCFEKIQDIYQNFADKAGDKNSDKAGEDKFSLLKEKTLGQLENLEASRLLEIARALHRRSDFRGALRLAEKSYGPLAQSPQGAVVLYIMGRSAQFSGDYKKARKSFEQYMESHSAGEDINEVQFRLSLVHFRLQNYSSAVAVLEKLLLSKSADRYDLGGRYWLIRSLQATQNNRSEAEIKILLEKYPLSYYGLKLRSEAQNRVLEPWPKMSGPPLTENLMLANFQKPIWERVLLLAENGWVGEAMNELSVMTYGSNPRIKVLLGQKLFKAGLYSPAIKLVMDGVDSNPDLQSLEILSLALPEAYESAILAQAQKNNLNPLLVKSLIRQESAFNEKATSTSKAMGLMQLIPPTAAEVAQDLGMQGIELPQDSYLPEINVQMGVYYIARMIKQFGGNVPVGLAAYNAGPTRISAFVRARPEMQEVVSQMASGPLDEIWMDELPWSETSFYVKAILRNTILYRLKSGSSVTLNPVLWSDLRLVP